jgi:hypothetical protein
MLQAACADAVLAFLIFLHLLERQAERLTEFCLGHTEHQAAHAHALPDVFVSWVYFVSWHRGPSRWQVSGEATRSVPVGESGRLVGVEYAKCAAAAGDGFGEWMRVGGAGFARGGESGRGVERREWV